MHGTVAIVHKIMVTRKIIRDLFDYLTKADYYSKITESADNEELNRVISDNWKNKIEEGLRVDFKRILFNDIEVEQRDSRFDIQDNEAQGATIWKSFVGLTDKNETMTVVINFIVNHDNAFIYLGASHTNLDAYSGTSETLRRLFKQLKRNEKVGHFFQTKFYDLS